MIAELLGLESRSLENPNVPLTDAAAFNTIFGSGTNSEAGTVVSQPTAYGLPAIRQAVLMLSGDAAKLPLNVYRRRGENDRAIAEDHPAHRLVRRFPNDKMHAFRFWRQIMVDMLTWEHAYARIMYRGGQPYELLPLLPDRTRRLLHLDPDGEVLYESEVARRLMYFRESEILHFQWLSYTVEESDDIPPMIETQREMIGIALAEMRMEAKFYKHGKRTGGILELPAGMPKAARDKVEEGFRKTHETPDGWFKTVILREGAKFHATSVAPREAQSHERHEGHVRDIARMFNLPPSRLGLSDSVSYNSKAEDNQGYLDTSLMPHLCEIAAECELKLLNPTQKQRNSHYFEHNTSALVRLDLEKRMSAYAIGIDRGVFTRNEVRAWENMPPVDGGDVPLVPLNMDSAGATDTPDEDAQPPAQRSAAERRVLYKLADRARDKAKRPNAFVEWVDGGLTWHRQHWADQVGAPGDDLLDTLAAELAAIAESVGEAELAERVDDWATRLEESTWN